MDIERFLEIQRRAIEAAEQVDCPMAEFKIGLAAMSHELTDRLHCEDVDPQSLEVLEQVERAQEL